MKKLTKKVVILSPRQKYGGSIVLHTLCQLLLEEGIDAKIFFTGVYNYSSKNKFKYWIRWILWTLEDIITCKKVHKIVKKYKRKILPFINKKNTIVIYPDVIYGNPLHAKHVVRYFLYPNRFKDDDLAYGKNDLFIAYRKKFNDYDLNPNEYIVNVHQFDTEIYKQTNFEDRTGNCYIIRKGRDRTDLPKEFDGPIIDDLSEKEKVKIFNKCKYCYSYDTNTFYTSIAGLCGCIPIVMLEEGKNIYDYTEKKPSGIAYGNTKEEIEYAINTRKDLLERLNNFTNGNKDEIKKFINLLIEKFER